MSVSGPRAWGGQRDLQAGSQVPMARRWAEHHRPRERLGGSWGLPPRAFQCRQLGAGECLLPPSPWE